MACTNSIAECEHAAKEYLIAMLQHAAKQTGQVNNTNNDQRNEIKGYEVLRRVERTREMRNPT